MIIIYLVIKSYEIYQEDIICAFSNYNFAKKYIENLEKEYIPKISEEDFNKLVYETFEYEKANSINFKSISEGILKIHPDLDGEDINKAIKYYFDKYYYKIKPVNLLN